MTANITQDITKGSSTARRDRSKTIQTIIKVITGSFAAIAIFTTIGILATLVFETFAFFQEIPIAQFLTDTKWTPLFSSKQFGIFVLISATVMIAVLSIAVALPLGLLSAICLSEYASPKVRRVLKPVLEDRKSTRLNSSHPSRSRMPSSA